MAGCPRGFYLIQVISFDLFEERIKIIALLNLTFNVFHVACGACDILFCLPHHDQLYITIHSIPNYLG
jgi:hypothetical protein